MPKGEETTQVMSCKFGYKLNYKLGFSIHALKPKTVQSDASELHTGKSDTGTFDRSIGEV